MNGSPPFRWFKDWAAWLSGPYREYDRRRYVRIAADVEVAITVPMGTIQGLSTNLTKGGVSVLVPEAITCGTAVFVRFPTIDRSAFAHVRRCVACGNDYKVA